MVNFENEQIEALANYFGWDIDKVRERLKTYSHVLITNVDEDFLYLSILDTESDTFEDYVLYAEGILIEHNRVEMQNGKN